MKWEDIEEQFEIEIPRDEPLFPMNIVCDLLHMQYHTLHEIVKEGIIQQKKTKKRKKLFSQREIKRLKYVQYLIEERGVNIKGVKVIVEMNQE